MICFAHISDLHFGSHMITGGWQVWRQNPHHLPKCLALPSALMSAMDDANLEDEDELCVVASGDMTVSGTWDELAIAQSYMRSRPTFTRIGAPFDSMGLNLPFDRLGIIPGNHDHWAGHRVTLPPYNRRLFPDHFRETPWSKVWQSSASAATLEIFGVDSNSGWGRGQTPALQGRKGGVLAQGRISAAEFVSLEQKLTTSYARTSPTVRAIACHHSLSFQASRYPFIGELEQASIDKLLELAGHYHVAAILTGHTHDSYAHTFQRPDLNGKTWYVQELRSAATLTSSQTKEERGFLMNRIQDTGGQWEWAVWKYGWDGKAFVSDPSKPWRQFSHTY